MEGDEDAERLERRAARTRRREAERQAKEKEVIFELN